MRAFRPHPLVLPLAALAIAAALLGACSSNKGTNPVGAQPETFSAAMSATGQSFQHTFATANPSGYCYHCTIHSTSCGNGMSGTIKVDDTSTTDSIVVMLGGGSNVFNPVTTTIKTGGYVRWVNSGGTHNVTRP
jgi:plastocyanin